jgi:hypothetical protein
MANAVYPIWKEALMQASANSALTGTGTTGVYCALIDIGAPYVYSAAHDFYNDLAGVVGTDQEIGATKTYTAGTFDGGDLTYTAVSGNSVEALVLYVKNAGANTTWRLVLYLDTSVTGLPVTPNGGNITITWNASGIFTLSDADAKENIRVLGEVGPAQIVQYNYRGDHQPRVGFIAQQIEQFAPEAVCRMNGRRAVDYGAVFNRIAQMR